MQLDETKICLLLETSALGQKPLSNNTLICLVDTTKKSYVEFWGDTIASEAIPPWAVHVKGRYYQHLPDEKKFGGKTFDFDFLGKR